MTENATRKSPWLRHLDKEQSNASDQWYDTIEFNLERLVSHLTAELMSEGHSLEESTKGAVNAMVNASLSVQRKHSPSGYISMLSTILSEDPDTETLRKEISDGAKAYGNQEWRAGVIAGISLSMFGLALGALAMGAFVKIFAG